MLSTLLFQAMSSLVRDAHPSLEASSKVNGANPIAVSRRFERRTAFGLSSKQDR